MSAIPLSGFKECDIRGEIGVGITETLAYRLGRAIGTVATEIKAVVGGDFRASTPFLLTELTRGLVASGVQVIDLGQLSTPAYYFARRRLGVAVGVMVTASHSPALWNGFKPVLGDYPITPEELEGIKAQVQAPEPATIPGGGVLKVDIKADYAAWLAERFASLQTTMPQVIFDCGSGATGWVIREVLERLGSSAEVLFDIPNGAFPHRSPDIARPSDLAILQAHVRERGAAVGIGFDGDGDRIGLVDNRGERVSSDQLIAWLAGELLAPAGGGAVIYDLKLSQSVPQAVQKAGGQPIAQKSGHTFIKSAMLQHDAIFGGEYSGHLFYRELAGGDDGLYSALLVCTLLARAGKPLDECLAAIPTYYATPDIRIHYSGDRPALIDAVSAANSGQDVLHLDGIKVNYAKGWALMRASVTEPALTFRFEGNTRDDMLAVAKQFLQAAGEVGDLVWNEVVKA